MYWFMAEAIRIQFMQVYHHTICQYVSWYQEGERRRRSTGGPGMTSNRWATSQVPSLHANYKRQIYKKKQSELLERLTSVNQSTTHLETGIR